MVGFCFISYQLISLDKSKGYDKIEIVEKSIIIKKSIIMNDQDYRTVQAMEQFGGSFVKALATACFHADAVNLKKIKDTWPEYWEQYEKTANKKSHENNF